MSKAVDNAIAARDRANDYLAGMAARGFEPEPKTAARLREDYLAALQELADDEGWEA